MLNSIISYFYPSNDQNNIQYIQSLLNCHNTNQSILQGLWLRDCIGIDTIIKDIFITKMGLKFEYQYWKISKYYNDNRYNKQIINSTNMEKYLNKKIKKLEDNKIYFIYLHIPSHVNLIYIDTRNPQEKEYYLYEPHTKDDTQQFDIINGVFQSYEYKNVQLPKFILGQVDLPLCYMYVMYFFLCLLVSRNGLLINEKLSNEYEDSDTNITLNMTHDNICIMNFTKQILKLCHKHQMINSTDYYLLSNNFYQIQNIIKNKYITVDDLFYKSADPDMSLYILQNVHVSNLNLFLFAHPQNYDCNYFVTLFQKIKKSECTLAEYIRHELYLLIYIIKYEYEIEIDDTDYFIIEQQYINKYILEKIMTDNNLKWPTLFHVFCQNYELCKFFINCIDNKDTVRRLIYTKNKKGKSAYDLISDKCDDEDLLSLINRRRQRDEIE
jgi:hypothetical protein